MRSWIRGCKRNETLTGGWGNHIGSDRHPTSFWIGESRNYLQVRPDELEMSRSGVGGRIAVCLDDRVVLWKPQPSHLVGCGPWEQPLVSLVPLLNQLLESVRRKIGLDGFVGIGLSRI